MIEITASPIGGENPPHDQAWRRLVAERAAGQAPVAAIGLHFRLRRGRRVDLDNLVRPAVAGLQDAGVFSYGFRNLDLLVASKVQDDHEGLRVDVDAVAQPGPWSHAVLAVAALALPREDDRASKAAWRDTIRDCYAGSPVDGPVWVDMAARTTGSLVALMKPIIDGLEPLLGRDPRGRLEFVPNDHQVERLTVRRQLQLPVPLVLAAGPLAFGA